MKNLMLIKPLDTLVKVMAGIGPGTIMKPLNLDPQLRHQLIDSGYWAEVEDIPESQKRLAGYERNPYLDYRARTLIGSTGYEENIWFLSISNYVSEEDIDTNHDLELSELQYEPICMCVGEYRTKQHAKEAFTTFLEEKIAKEPGFNNICSVILEDIASGTINEARLEGTVKIEWKINIL